MRHALIPSQRRPAAWARLLPWLAIAVFLLQIVCGAQHHHDGAAKVRHCTACALHAQPHAGPPPAIAPGAASGRQVAYRVFAGFIAERVFAEKDYVLPPAHAPPGFLPMY